MRKVYQLVLLISGVLLAAQAQASTTSGPKRACNDDLRDKAQILHALTQPVSIAGVSKAQSVFQVLKSILPEGAKKAAIVPLVKGDIDELEFKIVKSNLFHYESIKLIFRLEGREVRALTIKNFNNGKPVHLDAIQESRGYQVVVESLGGNKTFFLTLGYALNGDLVGLKLYTRNGRGAPKTVVLKVFDTSESEG